MYQMHVIDEMTHPVFPYKYNWINTTTALFSLPDPYTLLSPCFPASWSLDRLRQPRAPNLTKQGLFLCFLGESAFARNKIQMQM